MKFKSRPVKVEQPPISNHLLYEEMISAAPQVPLEVAVPSMPPATVSEQPTTNWGATSALSLPSSASNSLFSIIPSTATGVTFTTPTPFSTSTIPTITRSYSSPLSLMTSTTTASMIPEAVKSLNPLPNVPLTMAHAQSTSTPATLPLRIATNIFQDQNNQILKPANSDEINVGDTSKTNTYLTTGRSIFNSKYLKKNSYYDKIVFNLIHYFQLFNFRLIQLNHGK